MPRPTQLLRTAWRVGTAWGISVLLGLAFHGYMQYRQAQLQCYQAAVTAPVTARADILPLYAQSPFEKLEIEFPAGEISERYLVRIWARTGQPGADVESELMHYLARFYATSQTRIDARLSSIELELSSLQAEQRAKIFEMDYLRQHYAALRAQRIEQLHQEIRALGRVMDEKRALVLSAPDANRVAIASFEPVPARRSATALALQSVLVGLFSALLIILWRQRNRSGDAPA